MEHVLGPSGGIGTVKPLSTSWVVDVPHLLCSTLPHPRRFNASQLFPIRETHTNLILFAFPFGYIIVFAGTYAKDAQILRPIRSQVCCQRLVGVPRFCFAWSYSAEQGPIRVSSI